MFGTLEINKDELKVKDYNRYRAYYCGVCHELRKYSAGLGRLTLTYDMTFVAMLLDGLFDDESVIKHERCPLHPAKKHEYVNGSSLSYAADMNFLLAYDNLLDKWYDSRNIKGLLGTLALKKSRRKIAERHPIEAEAVQEYIEKLHNLEEEKCPEFEAVANATGVMFGKILSGYSLEWKNELSELGFYLGKFIYIADAYCDLEKDIKTGNYNPFVASGKNRDTTGNTALRMMAAETARMFERLPVVENLEILRNILFSGIWLQIIRKNEGLKNKNDKSL